MPVFKGFEDRANIVAWSTFWTGGLYRMKSRPYMSNKNSPLTTEEED